MGQSIILAFLTNMLHEFYFVGHDMAVWFIAVSLETRRWVIPPEFTYDTYYNKIGLFYC